MCNDRAYPVTVVGGGVRVVEPGGCVETPVVPRVEAPVVGEVRVEVSGEEPGAERGEEMTDRLGEETEALPEAPPVEAVGEGVWSVVEEALRARVGGLVEGYGCTIGEARFVLGGMVPGELDGEYVCCRLGCGGWGCAFRCRGPVGEVVVKAPHTIVDALLRGGPVRARVGRRFLATAETVRGLRRPTVVQLLGYGTRAPVLVYEYAGQGTLEWQLGHGWEPSPRDVAVVGVHLADALRYIHGRGLVHGDIKPGNIFLRDGVALLGDFSTLARLVSAHSRSAFGRGYTPGWRAPEQVYRDLRARARELGVEHRVDVYQLGNLLLYLLTGDYVDGEEAETALDDAVQAVGPGELREVVAAMMRPEPWERPSSEEALKMLARVYARLGGAEL